MFLDYQRSFQHNWQHFPQPFEASVNTQNHRNKIHGLERQCWGEPCSPEAKRAVHRNTVQQQRKSQCHCDFEWVEEQGGLAERKKKKDKNL